MLSLLIPVLNEKENILALYRRLQEIAEKLKPHPVEYIIIDDGSTDGSLALLSELAQKDPAVKIISFTRNFGSHAALRAGLEHAKGDAAVNISADLQEPPELIIEIFKKWQEGNTLVLGVRSHRNDPFLRKVSSLLAHKFIRGLVSISFPSSVFDICLLDRSIINEVILLEGRNVSFFNLILSLTNSFETVNYTRDRRLHGGTKWTFGMLVRLFINSIIPFSKFSMRLLFYAGIFLIQASVSFAVLSRNLPAIIVLCGFQTLLLMLITEYLMRTFVLEKSQARYLIKEKINLSK